MPWHAKLPETEFFVYTISGTATVNGRTYPRITGRTTETRGGGSTVPCNAPKTAYWSGHGFYRVVRVTKGIYDGKDIGAKYAAAG